MIDVLQFGLGWRQDIERRDELHSSAMLFTPPKTFSAPEEILHEWIKVENQGQMGSCSGQSMSTLQEVLNYVATGGSIVQLSRMFAYLAGQKMDGLLGQDQGATITGSVRAAREMGNCLETTFPYPAKYTPTLPQKAVSEAKIHIARNHVIMKSYDDCYKWLATQVGVIQIGISWTASLANNKDGVINSQTGQNYGGHALAVVGYSKQKDNQGRPYLCMVNSHGEGWGNKGRAIVAPALFDKWTKDQQSEVIGITDLVPLSDGLWVRDFKVQF